MTSAILLQILADGEFHSGTQLGEKLGLSRTAIWKQVSKLESELQIQIHSVRGKGYRLAERLDLLSKPTVREGLIGAAANIFRDLDIELKVDSTNNLVKQRDFRNSPYVCLAEMQTSGRGRHGRSWVSPFGKNLYLSVGWSFPEGVSVQQGLSLCVGIALVRVLHGLGLTEVGLKWPNDLVLNGRKLAGILLEATGEIAGEMQVIIGIGVNVNMSRSEGFAIEQEWTTVSAGRGTRTERNELVSNMLNELAGVLIQFEREGFSSFLDEWRQYDLLAGKRIVISGARSRTEGTAAGVSTQGALIVNTDSGRRRFETGEVSIRSSL